MIIVLFSKLHLNIYTAPAFFGTVMSAVSLTLFVTMFKDVRVVASSRKSIATQDKASKHGN